MVPPVVDSEIIQKKKTDGMSFRFDHKKVSRRCSPTSTEFEIIYTFTGIF